MQCNNRNDTCPNLFLTCTSSRNAVQALASYYCLAGKIGGTKFWQMSKNACFGEYNFGVSALAANVLCPAVILARQNLANNHPFAKFANFYSCRYFLLYESLISNIHNQKRAYMMYCLVHNMFVGVHIVWLSYCTCTVTVYNNVVVVIVVVVVVVVVVVDSDCNYNNRVPTRS